MERGLVWKQATGQKDLMHFLLVQVELTLIFTLATICQSLTSPIAHRLFVYGTLKRGFYNHNVYLDPAEKIGAATFLGEAITTDSFTLQIRGDRNIPALLEHPSSPIRGELFSVTEQVLQAMDLLEGVATGFYYRAEKSVRLVEDDKNTLNCWVYLQSACVDTNQPSYSAYTAQSHSLYEPPTEKHNADILKLLS